MEEDQERRLHKEKVEKYRGTFKIWLQHLLAEDEGINPRQTDPKNVARLLKIYQIDGCHRLDPQHYVPVVIEDERTYLTQSSSGSSSESPPFLQIDDDRKLKYLHGHHRLQAAKLFLSPADAWWTANLYSEGNYGPLELEE